jgi:hypothetical protein
VNEQKRKKRKRTKSKRDETNVTKKKKKKKNKNKKKNKKEAKKIRSKNERNRRRRHMRIVEAERRREKEREKEREKFRKLRTALESSDMKKLKYLIEEEGLDANHCIHGENILHYVKQGQSHFVEYLISKGADIKSENRCTCGRVLHHACRLGDKEIVNVLLKRGAKVNFLHGQDSKYGQKYFAPLHYASNGAIAKLLIQNGAYVNIEGELQRYCYDDKRYTPWFLSTDYSDDEDAYAMSRAKQDFRWTPLLAALKSGFSDVAKVLIENGGMSLSHHLQLQLTLILYSKYKYESLFSW